MNGLELLTEERRHITAALDSLTKKAERIPEDYRPRWMTRAAEALQEAQRHLEAGCSGRTVRPEP